MEVTPDTLRVKGDRDGPGDIIQGEDQLRLYSVVQLNIVLDPLLFPSLS